MRPLPQRSKTQRSTTVIQTARQAAKAAGVRLYSRKGLALAVETLRKASRAVGCHDPVGLTKAPER